MKVKTVILKEMLRENVYQSLSNCYTLGDFTPEDNPFGLDQTLALVLIWIVFKWQQAFGHIL